VQCNASTWEPASQSYGGGYSHWRCGKVRAHADRYERMDGAHRFINYVWEGPGHSVEYAPLPVRNADNTDWFEASDVIPFWNLAEGRHPIDSRRRSRQLRAAERLRGIQ
jgi:hypothetical protein